jgi:AraC-like DNA-binding protein/mannose-6-phosphate isomerase-like protein (cupin superfamily)
MSISENIFALTDQMFCMSDFSVVKKSVTPPSDFVCSYNSVLYERFFYVVKGTIIFDDERHKNLSFSAGDIIYLPAHTVYRSRWDTKEEGYFISLNFLISDSNKNIINLADDITLCCRDKSGELYRSFCETYDGWEKASQGYKLVCMSHLINVMREIAIRSERHELGKENRDMLKAIFYLEENYLQDVEIETLVKMTNLKESQFRRKFKKLKGMSPIKYRNLLRINKALELMRSGEYSVVEISMIVGFDDPNYFSRVFKSYLGQSPTQYICVQEELHNELHSF